MSHDSGPTTKEELSIALDELVRQAHTNGVDVDNGGYDLLHPEPNVPDWDVVITRLKKPSLSNG